MELKWYKRLTFLMACTLASGILANVLLFRIGVAQREDVARDEQMIALLATIAGQVRDPLRAEWLAVDGVTYSVTLSAEPGWTDETFEAEFDAKVARGKLRHRPAKGD